MSPSLSLSQAPCLVSLRTVAAVDAATDPLSLLGGFFAGIGDRAVLAVRARSARRLARWPRTDSPAATRVAAPAQHPRRLIVTFILGNELINISISAAVRR